MCLFGPKKPSKSGRRSERPATHAGYAHHPPPPPADAYPPRGPPNAHYAHPPLIRPAPRRTPAPAQPMAPPALRRSNAVAGAGGRSSRRDYEHRSSAAAAPLPPRAGSGATAVNAADLGAIYVAIPGSDLAAVYGPPPARARPPPLAVPTSAFSPRRPLPPLPPLQRRANSLDSNGVSPMSDVFPADALTGDRVSPVSDVAPDPLLARHGASGPSVSSHRRSGHRAGHHSGRPARK